MKRSTPWIFVLSLLLAVFWLSACTAETSPNADTANSTPENSAELTKETAEPALSPVTRTAQPSPQATQDTASSNSDVQDASTLDRAEVDMGDAVLVFQRTGGLMGVRSNDQIWYFYPDGRVTVSDGRSWQVKPEEIDALMNDIQPAQFATLEASYMPEDTCCDR
ncbi:MAG: hypothetical protein KC441_15360, partial [Anaerolineales bacterium]|nr:hypothetical protein [Anaerolineales bacterium]